MAENQQTFIDRIWRDKEGRQAVLLTPNTPLIAWFIFSVLENISDETIKILFGLLAFGFLFTWAWLEIISGTSYFRRVLGAIVLVILITNKLA